MKDLGDGFWEADTEDEKTNGRKSGVIFLNLKNVRD